MVVKIKPTILQYLHKAFLSQRNSFRLQDHLAVSRSYVYFIDSKLDKANKSGIK